MGLSKYFSKTDTQITNRYMKEMLNAIIKEMQF